MQNENQSCTNVSVINTFLSVFFNAHKKLPFNTPPHSGENLCKMWNMHALCKKLLKLWSLSHVKNFFLLGSLNFKSTLERQWLGWPVIYTRRDVWVVSTIVVYSYIKQIWHIHVHTDMSRQWQQLSRRQARILINCWLGVKWRLHAIL